ncbi:hypothetical protein [Amycolatopsis sp.]|jgi:membrane protein implicated in regulation of membrane protease activity|uniref:hypothetical protein n=1 Tax=Amycolatopsis sp. TaxID=37632 RepID=UPI002E0C6F83|nr:hypothetical protein [Amycolatopsis sp.]
MNNATDLAPWWGTLTLINAGLAQSKGRSGWNWWLLSLLLGPIATFLIVVWNPIVKPADTDRNSG